MVGVTPAVHGKWPFGPLAYNMSVGSDPPARTACGLEHSTVVISYSVLRIAVNFFDVHNFASFYFHQESFKSRILWRDVLARFQGFLMKLKTREVMYI